MLLLKLRQVVLHVSTQAKAQSAEQERLRNRYRAVRVCKSFLHITCHE